MKYPVTALRLREALNDKRMKPQELADLSGVNKASISQYVNGSHSPGNISAGKMSEYLGVSPLWLMGFDVEKQQSNSIENDLLKKKVEYIMSSETDMETIKDLEDEIHLLESEFKDFVKKENGIKSEDLKNTKEVISKVLDRNQKALEMYKRYENALPHVKAAVEALLKGSQ